MLGHQRRSARGGQPRRPRVRRPSRRGSGSDTSRRTSARSRSSRSSSITRSPPSRLPLSRRIAVVARVQVRELPLAAGALAAPARSPPPARAPRPSRASLPGVIRLGLQGVDSPQQAGEQARRVAADLVPAQRQVVQTVEQHRQPVREPDGGEEGVESRLQRVLAQQPLRRPPRRWRSRAPRRADRPESPARSRSLAAPARERVRTRTCSAASTPASARLSSRRTSASLRPEPAGAGNEQRTFAGGSMARALELGRRLSGPRWALSLHRANASACRRACRRPG